MFSPDFFFNIYFVCKNLKKQAFALTINGKKKKPLSNSRKQKNLSFLMKTTQTGIKVAFKGSKDTSG